MSIERTVGLALLMAWSACAPAQPATAPGPAAALAGASAPLAAASGSAEPPASVPEPPASAPVAPSASAPAPEAPPAPAGERWCAPEFEAIEGATCAVVPSRPMDGPRTLVIFLHGVVQPESGWQHAQQRAAARAAATHGFSVIMPRGRRGNGPRGMEDWWTWPTGAAAQAKIEDEVIAEWGQARAALEAKSGQRFERVWIFGFSNGAYYATDLALRGKLSAGGPGERVDGFGVFAGGAGARYLEAHARRAAIRAPIFVGWGGKDRAHGDQVKLAAMLRRLSWPSRAEGAPRAGHAMVDKHVADAVQFLAGHRPSAGPRTTPPPPARPRRARGH